MTQSIYKKTVCTIGKAAPILDAAKLMREKHVGDVVVTDFRPDGKEVPVGILTDRDIVVELVAEEIPLEKVTVGDVMCPQVVVAAPDCNLYDWICMMRVNGVKRLPLVDRTGALIGIVSADDLLEQVGLEVSGLAKIPTRQRKNEAELKVARR